MSRRRRELFPPDRGLQARMVATAVLTPLVVVAAVVVMILLIRKTSVLVILLALIALGVWSVIKDLQRNASGSRVLAAGEEPALQGIVDRLCVAADLPRPAIAIDPAREPNSWIFDAPGRAPRLHVTRGLLDLLTPDELEAVIAHELAHVAHQDATVMTVVGLPGAALQHGSRRGVMVGPFIAARIICKLIGRVSNVGTSSLSRHRELTADAGAAALTGKPSALASALLKVSGALEAIPTKDLRLAAAHDALHLLPVEEEDGWLWRTHPTVEKRVAALERIERRMVTARSAPPRD